MVAKPESNLGGVSFRKITRQIAMTFPESYKEVGIAKRLAIDFSSIARLPWN
jgi:hypothetical protein